MLRLTKYKEYSKSIGRLHRRRLEAHFHSCELRGYPVPRLFVIVALGVLSVYPMTRLTGRSLLDSYSQPSPGYAAWFKADAIVDLNDGDPVGTWEDSSPNNKNATQTTASLKPVFKTNLVAGKPVVRFDGTDDRLVSPGEFGVWGLSNDFTVFAVVWVDQGTGGHDVVGSSAISNNLDLVARRNDANGNWLAYSSSPDGARNSDLILSTGTWYVLTWRLKATSPKHLQIRADTAYRLNDTGYTGIGTAPSQVAIGARQNGVNPFKGDIAEVIFYTSSLSDADTQATENYLRVKYGFVPPPPLPPTALTATAVNHQRIDVGWTDNAENEDGYRIERRVGQNGTFVLITTVDPSTSSYSDQLLPAESEFCYLVIGFNATGGDSEPSNIACATTPAPPPACSDDSAGPRNTATRFLTGYGWEFARLDTGLTNIATNELQPVTDLQICSSLTSVLAETYDIEGDNSFFIPSYYQIRDRYIVILSPREAYATGIVILTDDFTVLRVYSQF